MKKAGIITLILGAVTSFASIVIPLCGVVAALLTKQQGVGIIGGADGPTAILITKSTFGGLPSVVFFIGACAFTAGIVLLIVSAKKKK
ncbi:MAG: hypothetical protein J6W15_07785 [Clostridia bacterium]|nr:hypothetical protein [Clostridia bacterium]MBO7246109.1 hypothetical protein [Clostridia bacterium]